MSENASSPIEQISAADCQKTPESVKHLAKTLVVRIEQLERQCEELKAENQLLRSSGKPE